MSSYFLCASCYSWVRPRGTRCPDCSAIVDPTLPDPALSVLQATIGELVAPLGPVRLQRTELPCRGVLVATTQGLFFAPHQVEEVLRYEGHTIGPPWWWRVMSVLWWPLGIISMLWQNEEVRPVTAREERMLSIDDIETQLLPELLMEHPGAMFVPQQGVMEIRERRGRWSLTRSHAPALIIQPEGNIRAFRQKMCDLLQTPAWRHLAVNC